jgi:ADP-ribose 1''-phosphate phosphatase
MCPRRSISFPPRQPVKRIQYAKGDLFDVKSPNSILVHACNCKGVWGSGIAATFKQRFPSAFHDYEGLCKRFKKKLLGKGFIFTPVVDGKPQQRIGYLFTSFDYGNKKDAPEKILQSTEKALEFFMPMVKDGTEIHSPKINSGLFAVPWEKTEALIEKALIRYPKVKWVVWELPPNAK